jgi:outer membrane protein TolC
VERLTFQQAVARALARNVQTLTAEAELRRAEALIQQARAASLPTLLGNAIYTRLDADRKLGTTVIAGQNQLSANLTLTVPLVAPQRWAQWSRAADNAAATRANTAEVRRQIAATAARAYLTLISQHRVIEVNERARATAGAHVEYTHARLAGGIGTRLDDARAEQQLETVQSQLALSYAALTRAQEALGALVGADTPVDTADEMALGQPEQIEQALKDARELRTDVKAYEERLKAAEHSVQLGWTDYLPLLQAVVQPFYQNPPTLTQPLLGWQANLVLSIPFYDGGLRYGQQHERVDLKTEAQVALEGTLRQAQSDVRTAFEAVRRNDAALRAAQNASHLATQALELSNLAYQAGATTNIEVIDAERNARDAETNAAIAEDGARQARLDLLVASGRFP